jgi:methyltransferase-like protein
MTAIKPNTYNEVPYPGYSYPQTHPDRLATLATLLGMKSAPVESCRVLELGCGNGGNLIPMAFELPKSEFFGIDLAANAIAIGESVIEALELKNIKLHPLDILEVNSNLGQFDYIITHGIYSWVPAVVREKMLTICKENLAPDGVAYISYKTYPGSRIGEMFRDIMLYRTQQFSDPRQRVDEAWSLINFLSESQPKSEVFRTLLKEQIDLMNEKGEQVLYHDDLSEVNTPFYFYQFIEDASKHGLQFLTEADFFEMQDSIYPPQIKDTLIKLSDGDCIVREQYLDFLKCRKFRQTLLCHEEIKLNRPPMPEDIRRFYIASQALPVSNEPDIRSRRIEEFVGPKGATMKTDYPLAKAAIFLLGKKWPRYSHFDELLRESHTLSGIDFNPEDIQRVALAMGEILLATYAAGLVALHVNSPKIVLDVSEHPVASKLVRMQLKQGNIVTNLYHVGLKIEDELTRHLLSLLDGTRDQAVLEEEMAVAIRSLASINQKNGEGALETDRTLKNLPTILKEKLVELARLALLVA